MTRSALVRTRTARLAWTLPFGLLATTAPDARALQACSTERVSVSSSGAQLAAGSFTLGDADVSDDGRYVVFATNAANLVAGDANGTYDVFLRDRQSGLTMCVSVDSSGAQGSSASGLFGFDVSADGNRIAFSSTSPLHPSDTNPHPDVYLHDRTSGQTTLVSASVAGGAANGGGEWPVISADGRFVAFESTASNLVSSDANGQTDVFVRDLLTGTTEIVSVSSAGVQAHYPAATPGPRDHAQAISADGRFVAFASIADNLVPGDTNGSNWGYNEGQDIFVRDRLLGTTTRVSVGTSGQQMALHERAAQPSISHDGSSILFETTASNLVPEGVRGLLVHDRLTGVTELVSRASDGSPLPESRLGRISGDGRHVLFTTYFPAAIGDTNGLSDVYLRDRLMGVTSAVSSASTVGDDSSFSLCTTPDARLLVWVSFATNLAPGDTNGAADVFVSGCTPPPFTAHCAGTASACPCANGGAPFSGCDNSLATGGGRLIASGAASLSADTLVLAGSGMPDSSALYFQGTALAAGGIGVAFGDGLRCAVGTIVRIATVANSGGASWYPTGAAPSVSQRGLVTAPGTRTYQVWYRNAAAFCTPSTFNLSNGIAVDWQS